MAQIPHVNPGEVIRASLINLLIDAANAGGGTTVPTGVAVPDLFGRTFDAARTMLNQPAVNLAVGVVIDASGSVVDPNAPGTVTRLVISQSPAQGSRVQPGSSVNLVLAAQGSGSGTGPQPPKVTGFNNASTPVGQPITIIGDNFDLTPANNNITFDGVPAGVPNPASKTSLTVTVPMISGVPKSVNVVVSINGVGSSTPMSTTITSSIGQAPTITNIDSSPNAIAEVAQSIKISGSGFSATAANNTVNFDTAQATPSAATTSQLTVTIPEIPGVNKNQPPKLVTVTVKVGSSTSSGFSLNVEKV